MLAEQLGRGCTPSGSHAPISIHVRGPPLNSSSNSASSSAAVNVIHNHNHQDDPPIAPPRRVSASPVTVNVASSSGHSHGHSSGIISSIMLTPPSHNRSQLIVSTSLYTLGSGEKISIYWDIKEETGISDWIALYRVDETDPHKHLTRKRLTQGLSKGQIQWSIEALELNCVPDTSFVVNFRYYSGVSYALRAVSSSITLRRSIEEPVVSRLI